MAALSEDLCGKTHTKFRPSAQRFGAKNPKYLKETCPHCQGIRFEILLQDDGDFGLKPLPQSILLGNWPVFGT